MFGAALATLYPPEYDRGQVRVILRLSILGFSGICLYACATAQELLTHHLLVPLTNKIIVAVDDADGEVAGLLLDDPHRGER